MAKLILISGLCLLTIATQAATYYGDAQLNRVIRSPHYGVNLHVNPPPPPFIYRTHNWSGVGRNNDGAVGSVFSGAAASAQSALPVSNAAFSLAEAGAVEGQFEGQAAESNDNSGSNGFKNSGQYSSHKFETSSEDYSNSKSGNSNSGGYSGLNSHITHAESGYSGQSKQNIASNGFGIESNRGYGQPSGINSGYTGNSGGYGGGYNKNFKESRTQTEYIQNGGGNQFGAQQSGYNGNQRNFDEGRQSHSVGLSSSQAQSLSSGNNGQYASSQGGSNGFGYGKSNGRSEVHGYETEAVGSDTFKGQQLKSTLGLEHSAGFSSSQAQSSSSDKSGQYGNSQGSAQSGATGYGYGNDNRRSNVHGYENQAHGSESFKAQQLKSTEESAGYGANVSGQSSLSGSTNGAGYGQHQSALHGALELASQGLQTAKNAECSTCQKSTYALSNAKSHSGSAIALSIGG